MPSEQFSRKISYPLCVSYYSVSPVIQHSTHVTAPPIPPSPQLPLPIPSQRFAILPTHDLHERLHVVAPVRRTPRLPVRLKMHRHCHNPTLADMQATVQASAPSRTTVCCTPPHDPPSGLALHTLAASPNPSSIDPNRTHPPDAGNSRSRSPTRTITASPPRRPDPVRRAKALHPSGG